MRCIEQCLNSCTNAVSFTRYEATEAHADLLRLPYDTLAQMISCSPDEIAIVESATTAWQQAFFGAAPGSCNLAASLGM